MNHKDLVRRLRVGANSWSPGSSREAADAIESLVGTIKDIRGHAHHYFDAERELLVDLLGYIHRACVQALDEPREPVSVDIRPKELEDYEGYLRFNAPGQDRFLLREIAVQLRGIRQAVEQERNA
jgi:hypothetical protein